MEFRKILALRGPNIWAKFPVLEAWVDLGVLKDLAGKTIMLGVIDLGDPAIESGEVVAGRIRAALKFVDPKWLVVAPEKDAKFVSFAGFGA